MAVSSAQIKCEYHNIPQMPYLDNELELYDNAMLWENAARDKDKRHYKVPAKSKDMRTHLMCDYGIDAQAASSSASATLARAFAHGGNTAPSPFKKPDVLPRGGDDGTGVAEPHWPMHIPGSKRSRSPADAKTPYPARSITRHKPISNTCLTDMVMGEERPDALVDEKVTILRQNLSVSHNENSKVASTELFQCLMFSIEILLS